MKADLQMVSLFYLCAIENCANFTKNNIFDIRLDIYMYIHTFVLLNYTTMKKHFLSMIAIAAVFMASCDTAPNGDNATVTDEKTLTDTVAVGIPIDTASSVVAFTGWGVGKNHPGSFKISEGIFATTQGNLTGGSFTININSMKLDQPEEMFQTKLRGHLLSADFFDAEKNPESKFVITSTEPYTPTGTDTSVVAGANVKISGNLTLKGITKNITFPAKVDVTESSVKAVANFNIDRTQWDMHYNDDQASAQDKFISHDVNIRLDVSGHK
jgi:polyisoprenoid-binding protein YceI